MIVWWVLPAIMSALCALAFLWTYRARDIFEAGIAFTTAFGLSLTTAACWILCFLLKVSS